MADKRIKNKTKNETKYSNQSEKQDNRSSQKYEKERAKEARKRNKQDDDRVHLFSRGKNFDFGLLVIIIILLTVGLIMILSASTPFSLRTEGDSYFYFKKQLLFAGIGFVTMLVVSLFDYRILNSRLSWLAYIGGLRTYVTCTGPRDRC